MHTFRVHDNSENEGVRWWAEDAHGFTGGADTIKELLDKIHEWAAAEQITDFEVRLPEHRREGTGCFGGAEHDG